MDFLQTFVTSTSCDTDELFSFWVKGQGHSMTKYNFKNIFGVAQQEEAYGAWLCASSSDHLLNESKKLETKFLSITLQNIDWFLLRVARSEKHGITIVGHPSTCLSLTLMYHGV